LVYAFVPENSKYIYYSGKKKGKFCLKNVQLPASPDMERDPKWNLR